VSFNWSDVRYWKARDDIFQFGYTVKPQQDGKFHAIKVKNNDVIKDVLCGRRKVAKSRAYRWYEKRMQTLRSQEDAAIARRELKERRKVKLTETEKKASALRKQIENANKRMNELGRVVKQSRARIKRAETKYSKWEKKQRRWLKALEQLEPSGRVQAFVKQFPSVQARNADA
jgi:hypothetical protein